MKTEVESLGEQWKAQFRAAASAQGVTEKRLRELDEIATQPAAVQQLMRGLQTLTIRDDESCMKLAEEMADYFGISISIFEAMAEHAYMGSWQTDPNWKVADTIEQQLNRPEGEGMETWKEMKSEVDHMIETGSVELAYRYDSEVQEVLRKAPHTADTKWVIARKLKKCAETSKRAR